MQSENVDLRVFSFTVKCLVLCCVAHEQISGVACVGDEDGMMRVGACVEDRSEICSEMSRDEAFDTTIRSSPLPSPLSGFYLNNTAINHACTHSILIVTHSSLLLRLFSTMML